MEPHDIGTRKDLAKYRLSASKDCLESAKLLLEAGQFKAANNRSYYAIMNAVNAIHKSLRGIRKRPVDIVVGYESSFNDRAKHLYGSMYPQPLEIMGY
ncbi:MAG: hypothetical protein LIO67_11435 [Lachnospiraceae bacterium]|nr:hypothetical protein [Lachnospiraceae bacterium]